MCLILDSFFEGIECEMTEFWGSVVVHIVDLRQVCRIDQKLERRNLCPRVIRVKCEIGLRIACDRHSAMIALSLAGR